MALDSGTIEEICCEFGTPTRIRIKRVNVSFLLLGSVDRGRATSINTNRQALWTYDSVTAEALSLLSGVFGRLTDASSVRLEELLLSFKAAVISAAAACDAVVVRGLDVVAEMTAAPLTRRGETAGAAARAGADADEHPVAPLTSLQLTFARLDVALAPAVPRAADRDALLAARVVLLHFSRSAAAAAAAVAASAPAQPVLSVTLSRAPVSPIAVTAPTTTVAQTIPSSAPSSVATVAVEFDTVTGWLCPSLVSRLDAIINSVSFTAPSKMQTAATSFNGGDETPLPSSSQPPSLDRSQEPPQTNFWQVARGIVGRWITGTESTAQLYPGTSMQQSLTTDSAMFHTAVGSPQQAPGAEDVDTFLAGLGAKPIVSDLDTVRNPTGGIDSQDVAASSSPEARSLLNSQFLTAYAPVPTSSGSSNVAHQSLTTSLSEIDISSVEINAIVRAHSLTVALCSEPALSSYCELRDQLRIKHPTRSILVDAFVKMQPRISLQLTNAQASTKHGANSNGNYDATLGRVTVSLYYPDASNPVQAGLTSVLLRETQMCSMVTGDVKWTTSNLQSMQRLLSCSFAIVRLHFDCDKLHDNLSLLTSWVTQMKAFQFRSQLERPKGQDFQTSFQAQMRATRVNASLVMRYWASEGDHTSDHYLMKSDVDLREFCCGVSSALRNPASMSTFSLLPAAVSSGFVLTVPIRREMIASIMAEAVSVKCMTPSDELGCDVFTLTPPPSGPGVIVKPGSHHVSGVLLYAGLLNLQLDVTLINYLNLIVKAVGFEQKRLTSLFGPVTQQSMTGVDDSATLCSRRLVQCILAGVSLHARSAGLNDGIQSAHLLLTNAQVVIRDVVSQSSTAPTRSFRYYEFASLHAVLRARDAKSLVVVGLDDVVRTTSGASLAVGFKMPMLDGRATRQLLLRFNGILLISVDHLRAVIDLVTNILTAWPTDQEPTQEPPGKLWLTISARTTSLRYASASTCDARPNEVMLSAETVEWSSSPSTDEQLLATYHASVRSCDMRLLPGGVFDAASSPEDILVNFHRHVLQLTVVISISHAEYAVTPGGVKDDSTWILVDNIRIKLSSEELAELVRFTSLLKLSNLAHQDSESPARLSTDSFHPDAYEVELPQVITLQPRVSTVRLERMQKAASTMHRYISIGQQDDAGTLDFGGSASSTASYNNGTGYSAFPEATISHPADGGRWLRTKVAVSDTSHKRVSGAVSVANSIQSQIIENYAVANPDDVDSGSSNEAENALWLDENARVIVVFDEGEQVRLTQAPLAVQRVIDAIEPTLPTIMPWNGDEELEYVGRGDHGNEQRVNGRTAALLRSCSVTFVRLSASNAVNTTQPLLEDGILELCVESLSADWKNYAELRSEGVDTAAAIGTNAALLASALQRETDATIISQASTSTQLPSSGRWSLQSSFALDVHEVTIWDTILPQAAFNDASRTTLRRAWRTVAGEQTQYHADMRNRLLCRESERPGYPMIRLRHEVVVPVALAPIATPQPSELPREHRLHLAVAPVSLRCRGRLLDFIEALGSDKHIATAWTTYNRDQESRPGAHGNNSPIFWQLGIIEATELVLDFEPEGRAASVKEAPLLIARAASDDFAESDAELSDGERQESIQTTHGRQGGHDGIVSSVSAALKRGAYGAVIALVPIRGLRLRLPRLRAAHVPEPSDGRASPGLGGWLVDAYLAHIQRHELGSIVAGIPMALIPPLNAAVAAAAGALAGMHSSLGAAANGVRQAVAAGAASSVPSGQLDAAGLWRMTRAASTGAVRVVTPLVLQLSTRASELAASAFAYASDSLGGGQGERQTRPRDVEVVGAEADALPHNATQLARLLVAAALQFIQRTITRLLGGPSDDASDRTVPLLTEDWVVL